MTRMLVLCLLLAGCGKKDDAKGANEKALEEGEFLNRDGVEVVECVDRFQPCGGDPTGLWEVFAMCDPGIDVSSLCNKAEVTVTRDRSAGTLELRENGTWERVYEVDVDYDIKVPESCLGPVSCSVLEGLSGTLVKRCKEKPNGSCDCNGTFKKTLRTHGDWETRPDGFSTEGGRSEICIDGGIMDTVDEDGIRVLWQ